MTLVLFRHVTGELYPGQYSPGVTTVNSRLIACGGNEKSRPVTASCSYLDTNIPTNSIAWKTLDDMPHARKEFAFVTCADVAYMQ